MASRMETSGDRLKRGPLAGDLTGKVPVRHYDVFINHRGPDLKKGLVSHLYSALQKVNFTSFVDNEEIYVGDLAKPTIKSAINYSRIHISVFSPGYAESAWCLDELLDFMECFRKKSSDFFLPVLFNVGPSDLRFSGGKSCYSSAFAEHARRYTATTIDSWKKALNEASMVKGYIFPDDFQGYEGKLVERIVYKVIEVLCSKTILYVPEHPVGVDEKLKEALTCMNRESLSGPVQKMGIYGMGGVGKTTLAKFIFNRLHREFGSASFVENVSDNSKNPSKGFMGLQKDILQDLLKVSEVPVNSTARGKQMMRDRLEGKNVLIVLDDVSEKVQLDQLLASYVCHLGMGSQIVITTRDQQVLRWAQVEAKLPMEGLHRNLALELFNFHAFHSTEEPSGDLKQPQEGPSRDLRVLAEKVADACYGLPLALEVLGADLQGKDLSEWEDTVMVLEDKKSMVNSQKVVTTILRRSFDALCSAEEEMFLDIACFLYQEPKEKAMRIWRSDCNGRAAELYLHNLVRKSLVKIDKNGKLTMHDLLRDMGWEIVDDSHKYYWERSHLWREDDVYRVLKKKKGTSHVRGLKTNVKTEWDTMSFTGMDELKLLVLSEVTLTGDLSKMPQELRWFQLRHCQLEAPFFLNLEYVAVLDLEGSKWTSFNCADYMSQNLKELNLSSCSNLKELPFDFGKSCSGLEILILRGCVNLEMMPDSISELGSSLRYLDMSECGKLTTLPNGFTNLRALVTLLMNGCGGLTELPVSIGQLTALEEIGLDGVPLCTLPPSFGSLSSLVSLGMHHSSKLTELPSTIGNLTRLTSLDILSCPLLSEIPEAVTKLTNLVHFRVSDCDSISELPRDIERLDGLVELHVHGIGKLTCLPLGIRMLWKLKVLNLQGCAGLRRVDNLPWQLTSLGVVGCTNLETLNMQGCSELKALPDGLEGLPLLSRLDIMGCSNILDLPGGQLEKLTSLKELHLGGSGVTVVQDRWRPWIQKMISLEVVTMMPDANFTALKELGLRESGVTVVRYRQRQRMQGMRGLNELARRSDSAKHVVVPEGDTACCGVLCCFQCRASVLIEVRGKGDESLKFYVKLEKTEVVFGGLQICIYRASHPMVASLKGGDTIHVKSEFVEFAAIKLMYGESEMEETLQSLTLFNRSPSTGLFWHFERAFLEDQESSEERGDSPGK